jgi:23S rRNA (adenine-N6)-dimethyltransferase
VSAGHGRRWGWHWLEPEWAERIVAAAGVHPDELVLDLGAGTGALTAGLLDAGARVVAVELHPGPVAGLRERFAGQPRVRVVSADLALFGLPRRPFRVVANPPYSLRAQILRRLLAPQSRMYAGDLVFQRWAVERVITQRSGGHRWDASMGLRLPRHAFAPPPPVDSAVLRLRR